MAQLVTQMRASYAFIERNLNLTKRYWGWELVWLTYSMANALAITFIGAGMEAISGVKLDTSYLILFLLAGTLIWHFLSIVFDAISEVIAWERWEGTIEYTLMAPIRRVTHMAGQTMFAVAYSILFTGVILIITTLVFDLDLSQSNLLGGVVILLAGSFSFIGVGIMASTLPLLFPERGSQMTHVFIALMLLVSGVYYPVEVLPEALQKISVFSPATYVLTGVRQAILEGVPTLNLWGFIWPVLIMGAILLPAGLWVFKQAEVYAKRTGKLHRNG